MILLVIFGFPTLGKLAVKGNQTSFEKKTILKIIISGKMSRQDKSSVPVKPRAKPPKKFNFCDDQHFDENLSVIKIEHTLECPVFNVKAHEIFKYLNEKHPRNKFKLLVNEETDGTVLEPREGAFEMSFAKNCRLKYHLIWSGIDKGPPRREKFPPDLDELARKIQKILVTE